MHLFLRFLITISFCLAINCQTADTIDPDLQLCEDETVDAAVYSDDRKSYIFKGDYYWEVDSSSGISQEFGEPIKNSWIDLPTPIDAAFAIDEQTHRDSTVFIKENQWFLYKNRKRIMNGQISDWNWNPEEPINIDAALTYINPLSPQASNFPIYLIHHFCYTKLKFHDIEHPVIVEEGDAEVRYVYLYFLNYSLEVMPRQKCPKTWPYANIQYLMPNLTAMFANTKHIVIFGVKQYCIAEFFENGTLALYPNCVKHNSTEYFKCPRNARPTTSTTPTTPTTPTSTSVLTQSSQSDDTLIKTTDDSVIGTDSKNPLTESGAKSRLKNNNQNSNILWFVLFFALLAIVGIIFCTVAAIVIRKQKKSSKKISRKSKSKSEDNEYKGMYGLKNEKKRSSNEESLENKRSKESTATRRTESNESLNTQMKRSKSKLTDLDETQEKTATTKREGVGSIEEADQMIERVKSRDDLYLL